jgi:hypothetical protein
MRESNTTFVLIDEKTAPVVLGAIDDLQRPITKLCFGDVKGVLSVNKLFLDDGSGIYTRLCIKYYKFNLIERYIPLF